MPSAVAPECALTVDCAIGDRIKVAGLDFLDLIQGQKRVGMFYADGLYPVSGQVPRLHKIMTMAPTACSGFGNTGLTTGRIPKDMTTDSAQAERFHERTS